MGTRQQQEPHRMIPAPRTPCSAMTAGTPPTTDFTSPVLNGKGGSPSSSAPSSVGEALSDITPAQYVTKPGFKITPDGTVVNFLTGDVMSIITALDRGYVIDKSLSEKDTDFTSDISSIGVSSTVSSIYDRVSTKMQQLYQVLSS